MGKAQKLYLNYDQLKNKNKDIAANADDSDLMILGALLLTADRDGAADVGALEELERFEKSEITASLKFCVSPRPNS